MGVAAVSLLGKRGLVIDMLLLMMFVVTMIVKRRKKIMPARNSDSVDGEGDQEGAAD